MCLAVIVVMPVEKVFVYVSLFALEETDSFGLLLPRIYCNLLLSCCSSLLLLFSSSIVFSIIIIEDIIFEMLFIHLLLCVLALSLISGLGNPVINVKVPWKRSHQDVHPQFARQASIQQRDGTGKLQKVSLHHGSTFERGLHPVILSRPALLPDQEMLKTKTAVIATKEHTLDNSLTAFFSAMSSCGRISNLEVVPVM